MDLKDIKISLCIPTLDRYDDFLSKYLDYYFDFLLMNIINEIVICDENGNDHKKIMDKYGDFISKNPNIKLIKNDNVLGIFRNKLKCCENATNEFVSIIDSDNFADRDYFDIVRNAIKQNIEKYNNINTIYAPTNGKSVESLNYSKYNDVRFTRNNIKKYIATDRIFVYTILNTGNYTFHKNLITQLNLTGIDYSQIYAIDVVYFNLLCFQQINGFEIHMVPELSYYHALHSQSEYVKTNKLSKMFYMSITDGYYKL